MLNSATLALLREIQELTMPESATIKRPSLSQDSTGGLTGTPSTIGTVSCRVTPVSSSREEVKSGEVSALGEVELTFPYGTNLLQTDQVEIGSYLYEVVAILNHSYSTALRVRAIRR